MVMNAATSVLKEWTMAVKGEERRGGGGTNEIYMLTRKKLKKRSTKQHFGFGTPYQY